ncbi:hypothetical protein Tsubulata_006705 [Turnera subulata]|uniref:TORTIFOLIA1/SINE1-2 N-terminal domain-containing protein n=1 Tax=Turnera subulata TaxID=218843 RepID=A0A9Q0JSS9_9ROSI|nr:hypothetical protein Tsubulata_006705 [Turnera subulata]
MAQNFKLKILTLITKLSDRDTYTLASTELTSVAQSLDAANLSTFLSCILSTDANDKSLARKHCLHLISTLSSAHRNSLSSSLPKILAYIARRLRDSDSSVRSQCVAAVSSLAANVTKPAFSTAFLKPLSEAVFTEQEAGAQVGSALCLAAAIDAAPDPEPVRLGRALVGRIERLVKSEGYKAKSAGLVVLGSVVGVGGARGGNVGGLVKCFVGFLSSEDWASRKAAAEGLLRLAVVERDSVMEFKSECEKVFVNRRFDKVKAVREVMNQMIEAWRQVPDVSDNVSPPPRSVASSKEDAGDGRYPPGTKVSSGANPEAAQARRRTVLGGRATPPDSSSPTVGRKRGLLRSTEKKMSPATLRKGDHKQPSDWKVEEAAVSNGGAFSGVSDGSLKDKIDNALERRSSKPETRRALFQKNSDDKGLKLGGCKSGSRVAPCCEGSHESVVSITNENCHVNHKECEDLSSIRNQLLQIERQQSSLLDLLQRFMGTSQNGMRSLETRVHGLELALDEISYDLAVSSGRMTNTSSQRTSCCLLPAADFLSSKFWKKTEGQYSTSRFLSSRGTTSLAAMRHRVDNNANTGTNSLDNPRLHPQVGGGFIVNPLAEIHGE